MYLIDANVLLYASINSYDAHSKVKSWFDDVLNSNKRIGLPWESILAYIRIATNSRIFEKPLSAAKAWEQTESWLSCENVWIPNPKENHREILQDMISDCEGSSGLIHDAHLAALAIGHGLIIVSADADFSRFKGIRYINPLKI